MSEVDLQRLLASGTASPGRIAVARWVEGERVQRFILIVILFNALLLGLESNPTSKSWQPSCMPYPA